jgi:hypothetical protein
MIIQLEMISGIITIAEAIWMIPKNSAAEGMKAGDEEEN